jgi:hypothetical protein
MSQKPPPPSRAAEQFVLRLPPGLRDKFAERAKSNNRSMNAELVQRLETSLASEQNSPPAEGDLSWYITAEIKQMANEQGVPFDEMLVKLIFAGLHPTAPQVLYVALFPGTTKEQMRAAMEASNEFTKPDTSVVMEMLQRAPWKPSWLEERLKVAAEPAPAKNSGITGD